MLRVAEMMGYAVHWVKLAPILVDVGGTIGATLIISKRVENVRKDHAYHK